MTKRFFAFILATSIALPPLSAYATPSAELTHDEQIDALKAEIELRKAALCEVREAVASAETGRAVDKLIVSVGALAAVGVWFIPGMSFLEKGIWSGINGVSAGTIGYQLVLKHGDVERLHARMELTQSYITIERDQLAKLLHDPSYTLSRDQQMNALSSSIELRQAAIADLESRIASTQHIGFTDVAVIAGSALAGAAVWFVPPARLSIFAKQLTSVLAWVFALGKTGQVVVAKQQLPELRDQLQLAREYLSRDEHRLAEISGLGLLAANH